jgi:hypothetical protein
LTKPKEETKHREKQTKEIRVEASLYGGFMRCIVMDEKKRNQGKDRCCDV